MEHLLSRELKLLRSVDRSIFEFETERGIGLQNPNRRPVVSADLWQMDCGNFKELK